ncbi:MAG TPA: helix-turn-helix domain-containing protein [Blastocatellia bacterium]|nr:helix-turn-helix domain-containing protein [Blastocatellia bacterium]
MSSNRSEAATTAREQPSEADKEKIAGRGIPDADDTQRMATAPKPDVSDQGQEELLPRLLNYFHNNREELARALGVHRSSVDRWMNGTSRPNNSTLLRMRRLAQERRIE